MNSTRTKIKTKGIAATSSLLLFTGIILLLTGMTTPSDSIVGKWESEDKDLILEFLKSEGTYFARLIYSKDAFEADGNTFKKDVNNPDPELRNRSLQGIIFIQGLTYDYGTYKDGILYVHSDGHFYQCKVILEGSTLYLRVYKGISLLGKTIEFKSLEVNSK